MHAGKSYWPELVGAKPLDAKAVILSENPHVDNVVIAVYPAIAPPDFCCNRVYVWIDRPDGTLVGAKPLDAKAVILRENPQVDNVMIVVYPGIARRTPAATASTFGSTVPTELFYSLLR
uniref:Uncharacterized protein n=1 Tax=Ananas comosus var. bracteatus TaxID=296719 RepID=A0A6V7PQM5_ANACO|nr:unnamed protein product [Ananas comosus var. bracteatus]